MAAVIAARYWQAFVGAAVTLALIVTLTIRTHQRDAARAGWKAETAAHQATIANYRAASALAQQQAHDAAVAADTRNAAITEKTNHDAQVAIADAQRRADEYIAAHRVRGASTADSRGSGQSGMSQATSTSQSDNGPGSTAPVAVSADDINTCTEAAVRLQAAHGWAVMLNFGR